MKQLSELALSVPAARLLGGDAQITGLATDSREKDLSGKLFICISGGRFDGHAYADAVKEKGAAALVVERQLDCDLPQLLVPDTRAAWAHLASAWFDHPAEELRLIGITGTKGKTTTTTLITRILEHAGYKVGLLGTVMNYVAGTVYPQHLTTPDPMELHEMLRRMVDAGCTFCVMEVSAHAAALRKVAGLEFEVMGFTNLSQDHLNDFHTMEKYGAAKALLFRDPVCRMAIVNGDDPFAPTLLCERSRPVQLFSLEGQAALRAEHITSDLSGLSYNWHAGPLVHRITMKMGGRFNVQNSLLAASVCLNCGLSAGLIAEALAAIPGVDGRLERVEEAGELLVFVDYAHSPDSLDNVLQTIRAAAKGKVWTVFGCGGDRDRTKRPIMARLAEQLSDFVIVTSDNPRTEDPEAILDEMMTGFVDPAPVTRLVDRREAIYYALTHAASGDTVLIAGKGHETYQEINGIRHPFDDRQVVRDYFS